MEPESRERGEKKLFWGEREFVASAGWHFQASQFFFSASMCVAEGNPLGKSLSGSRSVQMQDIVGHVSSLLAPAGKAPNSLLFLWCLLRLAAIPSLSTCLLSELICLQHFLSHQDVNDSQIYFSALHVYLATSQGTYCMLLAGNHYSVNTCCLIVR